MRHALLIFLPHLIGVVGALVILYLGWRTPLVTLLIALPSYALVLLVAIGLTPSSWLHVRATSAASLAVAPPTSAVVLGFGYEMAEQEMRPGTANQFLVDWVTRQQPQINTLLVQEGVRSAMTPTLLHDKNVRRIHRHDPAIYVDTLDTAFCALRQLQQLNQKTVLLVAHDLQLQRAAWDFERVRQAMCLDCTVLIAAMPDTPYPAASVHFQTHNEFVYKLVELLLLRPRDFLRATPTTCKAPI